MSSLDPLTYTKLHPSHLNSNFLKYGQQIYKLKVLFL